MKYFNFKKKINIFKQENVKNIKLSKNKINLINVNYNKSKNSNIYIEQCFSVAFRLIKNKFSYKLINGPFLKKFLQKNI